MLRSVAWCVASTMCLVPTADARPLLEDRAAARAALAGIVADHRLPGAAYVSIANGEVVYSDAVGVASRRTRKALTSATPMLIGSVSKPIAAAALMTLVEEGRVGLDLPITTYLPDLRLADPAAAQRITVRQVLSHTSGLGTFDGRTVLADLGLDRDALRRHLAAMREVHVQGPPPRPFEYSNLNYQLVGAIIAAVSGEPYERYVERRLFAPLGMQDSFVVDPPRGVPMPSGHRPWLSRLVDDGGALQGRAQGPTGFAAVPARDLGKFLAAMASGRDDILRAQTKLAMLSPQPESPGYGLGWFLRTKTLPRYAYHAGYSPGFSAWVVVDPQNRRAFGVIVNQGDGFLHVSGRATREAH